MREARKRAPTAGRTAVKLERNLSLYFARHYLGLSYGQITSLYNIKKCRAKQIICREATYIEGEEQHEI